MVDSRKTHLLLFLPGIFCLYLFFGWAYTRFSKKSHWQPWIWHLFTSHWMVYL